MAFKTESIIKNILPQISLIFAEFIYTQIERLRSIDLENSLSRIDIRDKHFISLIR